MIACSTIAVGSGIRTSSTPIRIMPPAMPKMPDRNAVPTIKTPSAAIISGVTKNLLLQRFFEPRAALPRLPLPALRGVETSEARS